MDKKSKIGILKYIASSGAKGVKFEDQPETWYNPSTDEAKDQVKEEYKGKKVEIMLVQGKKTEFSSMVLLNEKKEETTEKQAVIEEETIVDVEEPEKAKKGDITKIEGLYNLVAAETNRSNSDGIESIKDIKLAVKKKLAELNDLISEEGAIHIVASDLKCDLKKLLEGKKEEKVPQAPPKEEEKEPTHVPVDRDPKVIKETQDQLMSGCGPIEGLLKAAAGAVLSQEYTHDVYSNMEKTKLETAKKGTMGLTYASWSEAWGALKRVHPTTTFKVHEQNGLPYFMGPEAAMGAFVKVSVTVMGLTHTVHLPVMDHSNKSITKINMTSFDVNKNIQRALAKAIALHGMGLYVFKGEDYPEDTPTKK